MQREIARKLTNIQPQPPDSLTRLHTVLERAERIRTQQPKDKNKLYALHAPEVECIALTHKSALVVAARTFAGNPYDGHILHEQLEQTGILLEDAGSKPRQVGRL